MEPSSIVTPIERGEARSWETRLLSEVALRESGEHYRFLYNKTPVMLHSVDSRGLLVSVSDYWLEVLGYERGEVLGRPSVDILTEASRDYSINICLPEFMKTGSLKDEPLQYQRKNGEVIETETADTLADGLATRRAAEMTLGILRALVHDMVLVSEDEIREAIRLLLRETHNLAEGAGAASLAAACKLRADLAGKRVVRILSGGNIDAGTLRRILDSGD